MKKTKAQKLAEWAMGIIISYFVLLTLLILFLNSDQPDTISFTIVVFCVYLSIPVLIMSWILSIWSLRLERKIIGFWALLFTIIYTFVFGVVLYLFTTVKMC